MEVGAFSLLRLTPGKMASLNSRDIFPFSQIRGVYKENSGLLAYKRAEEAFVLTSVGEARFPPSLHRSQASECLC